MKIWKRSILINEKHLNKVFNVHNGNKFFKVFVTELMLGHKFGEYALTKKLPQHKKNKSK